MDFRDKWLLELGQRMCIPSITFNAEGCCQLTLNSDITVIIFRPAETEQLLLFGQMSHDNLRINLMQQLLIEDSQYEQDFPVPILSISDNFDGIQIHFELTEPELEVAGDAIGKLLDKLEYWHKKLSSI